MEPCLFALCSDWYWFKCSCKWLCWERRFYGGRIFELLYKRGGGSASLTGSCAQHTAAVALATQSDEPPLSRLRAIVMEMRAVLLWSACGWECKTLRVSSLLWKGSRQTGFDFFSLFTFLINGPGLFEDNSSVHVNLNKNVWFCAFSLSEVTFLEM